MSKPCKQCQRQFPTPDFIGQDGVCIICARLPKNDKK